MNREQVRILGLLQAQPSIVSSVDPVLKVISGSGLSLEKGAGTVCFHAADAAVGQPNLLILAQRLAALGELSSSTVPIQGIRLTL